MSKSGAAEWPEGSPQQTVLGVLHNGAHSSLTGAEEGVSLICPGAAEQQRTNSHMYRPWAACKTVINSLCSERSQAWVVSLTRSEVSMSNLSEYSSLQTLFCTAPYLVKALTACLNVPLYLPSVLLQALSSSWCLLTTQTSALLSEDGARISSLPSFPFNSKLDRLHLLSPSPSLPRVSSLPLFPFNSSPPTGTDSCGANTPSSVSAEALPFLTVHCLSGFGRLLCLSSTSLLFILSLSVNLSGRVFVHLHVHGFGENWRNPHRQKEETHNGKTLILKKNPNQNNLNTFYHCWGAVKSSNPVVWPTVAPFSWWWYAALWWKPSFFGEFEMWIEPCRLSVGICLDLWFVCV